MHTKKLNLYKAFTLAEVLITLAVIGVVAAMSIPSLQNNINEKQYKTAWKTAYSTLSQAYMNIKRKNGGTLVDYFDGTSDIRTPLVKEFNKIVSQTGSINYSAIDGNDLINYVIEYKDLTGQRVNYFNFGYGNLEFINGMHLYIRTMGISDYYTLWVDVNGAYKGPNILGRDLFVATFTKDWIKPTGAPGTHPNVNCAQISSTCGGYGVHSPTNCAGIGCSAQYLYEE